MATKAEISIAREIAQLLRLRSVFNWEKQSPSVSACTKATVDFMEKFPGFDLPFHLAKTDFKLFDDCETYEAAKDKLALFLSQENENEISKDDLFCIGFILNGVLAKKSDDLCDRFTWNGEEGYVIFIDASGDWVAKIPHDFSHPPHKIKKL